MKQSEASAKGRESGIQDVLTVLQEQGIEVLRATLKPGVLGWDEGAINAGAHKQDGVPDTKRLREAYYRAYAKAAREQCEQLVADHDAETNA